MNVNRLWKTPLVDCRKVTITSCYCFQGGWVHDFSRRLAQLCFFVADDTLNLKLHHAYYIKRACV
jgi:hypothetical protein